MAANEETPREVQKFDFSAFPSDTLFFDRREGRERRTEGGHSPAIPGPVLVPAGSLKQVERAKKERRKRIDPTTFEKQYTGDELEFMNAMQRFKVQSGKAFPNYREVLDVAGSLGYRRLVFEDLSGEEGESYENMMDVPPATV
ncbi:MAG: hypothetical protein JWN86_3137 [Planctomycetota bacterium]|nr:hypothetical protein [Planctomycetota bacterium]